MHVSVTRVSTGDLPIDTATVVAQEMMRWFRESEGFEGLMFLSRPGTTLAVSFWESREIAERNARSRMQFRDRISEAAGVQVEDTTDYAVMFASFNSPLSVKEESGEGGI
jgi:hypothetical protein